MIFFFRDVLYVTCTENYKAFFISDYFSTCLLASGPKNSCWFFYDMDTFCIVQAKETCRGCQKILAKILISKSK